MLFSLVALSICLFLIVFFLFRNPFKTKKRLKLIRHVQAPVAPELYPKCRSNADCTTDRVCHLGACLLKLRTEENCDSSTGAWTPIRRNGLFRVACVCLRPDLATQRRPGGDCDLDLTCGEGGRLKRPFENLLAAECECSQGFTSRRNPLDGTPSCRPETAFENMRREDGGRDGDPCSEDEMDVQERFLPSSIYNTETPFPRNYFVKHRLPEGRCVKRPCLYDALSGRRLKRTRFEQGWGCVCDPRRGNLGVRLEDPESHFLHVPGYNACVNIFEKGEPTRDVSDVRLYTYFYVFDNLPVSFVQWFNLTPEILARPFRQILLERNSGRDAAEGSASTLQIEEIWPHNYTQYVLKHPPAFVVSVPVATCRRLYGNPPSIADFLCEQYIPTHYRMPACKDLLSMYQAPLVTPFQHYPICRVDPGDAKNTDVYDGWIVTNPLYVTSRDALPRYLVNDQATSGVLSNGIELKPYEDDEDLWQVAVAPSDEDLEGDRNPFVDAVVPSFSTQF